MAELTKEVVDALDAQRDALNARFALRVRGGAAIDGDALLEHLRGSVLPLVETSRKLLPEKTGAVLAALYDVSLDLFAASLLGKEARVACIELLWREVLPGAAAVLVRQPQQVAASLSNALFQLASQRGTHPETWIERMKQAAGGCGSLGQLLDAGTVAAWQSGMVQFRHAALECLARLPTSMAAALLDLPPAIEAEEFTAIVGQMAENPWLVAADARSAKMSEPTLRPVAMVGAFTGFGGEFSRPPVVRCQDGQLIARDGTADWQLYADVYGAWFRRLGESTSKQSSSSGDTRIEIDRRGTIRWQGHRFEAPHLAERTGCACDGRTLAVTIPTSHHLFLFGLGGQSA